MAENEAGNNSQLDGLDSLHEREEALDSLNRAKEAGRKSVNPDDVVNLEKLVRDYERQYGDRLAIDDEEDEAKPKGKPKTDYESAYDVDGKRTRRLEAPEPPRRSQGEDAFTHEINLAKDDLKKAGREISEGMSKVGAEIGRAVGKISVEFGKASKKTTGKEFGKGMGRDFGEKVEHFFKTPYEAGYQSYDTDATPQERNKAAWAHGSSILTLAVGTVTGGLAVPFLMFIPLLIYMANRDKSEFVAKHAMQAFVMQLVGTIGFLAAALGGLIVGVLLTVLLAITIVGILAIPFLWIAIAMFWAACLVLPLGMGGLGVIGALTALQGKTYKYPYVGKWVDREPELGRKADV